MGLIRILGRPNYSSCSLFNLYKGVCPTEGLSMGSQMFPGPGHRLSLRDVTGMGAVPRAM